MIERLVYRRRYSYTDGKEIDLLNPPLYPPATVKLIAMSLQNPTITQFKPLSISNPSSPLVGHT